MSDPTSIKILRDTGVSQSFVLSDTLPFSEESSVGASFFIRGINCSEYSPVLLHTVYLKSNLVTGQPSLPFEGVHLRKRPRGRQSCCQCCCPRVALFRTVSRSNRKGNSRSVLLWRAYVNV